MRPRRNARRPACAFPSGSRLTRYLPFPTHRTVEDAVTFLRHVERGWADGTEYTWVLEFQPDVHRIWAYRDLDNVASGRVLEKAGLPVEATLRRTW